MSDTFSLRRMVKHIPRLPYGEMKRVILGDSYILSLAFVGEARSKTLNHSYRRIHAPATVLAFALTSDTGEVIVCPPYAKKRSRMFEVPYTDFVGYLVIHGMLHIRGMEHGAEMERFERFFCKKFSLEYPAQSA